MATKTFLFVDQVDSTEQLTELGDATAQPLCRALFDLLRQATELAGGHEVDVAGDGLFCSFDGAAEAVEAAVSMQQLVWSFSGRRPAAQRLAIRVGLNSGEPLESADGGYFGTAVVVAARLCSAAIPGQILVSGLVRGLVEPRGAQTFHPVGPLDLKGVPVPVEAWAVAWEPDARRAPVPPLLASVRTTPFVGRRRELDAVDGAWARALAGDRPLVAVSADHGSGVTRLLAEAAARLHDRGAAVWAGRGHGPESRLEPWAESIAEWAGAVPRAELHPLGDVGRDVPFPDGCAHAPAEEGAVRAGQGKAAGRFRAPAAEPGPGAAAGPPAAQRRPLRRAAPALDRSGDHHPGPVPLRHPRRLPRALRRGGPVDPARVTPGATVPGHDGAIGRRAAHLVTGPPAADSRSRRRRRWGRVPR